MLNLQPLRDRLGCSFQPFSIISVIDERDSTHTIDPLHIVSIDDAGSSQDSNGV